MNTKTTISSPVRLCRLIVLILQLLLTIIDFLRLIKAFVEEVSIKSIYKLETSHRLFVEGMITVKSILSATDRVAWVVGGVSAHTQRTWHEGRILENAWFPLTHLTQRCMIHTFSYSVGVTLSITKWYLSWVNRKYIYLYWYLSSYWQTGLIIFGAVFLNYWTVSKRGSCSNNWFYFAPVRVKINRGVYCPIWNLRISNFLKSYNFNRFAPKSLEGILIYYHSNS